MKNRIKSTLSIKGNLFVKVARSSAGAAPSSSNQVSKGSWWTLSEEAQTALRDGNVPAVVRAKPPKSEKDGKAETAAKEGSQERGRDSTHNGGRSGTSSAAHSRRNSPVRVGNAARSARGVGSGHNLSRGQQEIQAMTMTMSNNSNASSPQGNTASPQTSNHAALYGMTSLNPAHQNHQHYDSNASLSDSPDGASPDSVSTSSSSKPSGMSSLAMSPTSTSLSMPTFNPTGHNGPSMPFPWVGNASASSSSPPSNSAIQDQEFPPMLNLGGIGTPSGPGHPNGMGMEGLDSLTRPFDPSSEVEGNDRQLSPTASSSLSLASGSGSGSSRSRGASEELGGLGGQARKGGASSTSGNPRPTGSRRGSLEHVSFTLPVDSAGNNRAPGTGPINPPNSNPSNRNLSSGEWEQLQQFQRQQISEQRFKQQLQSSLLREQQQQANAGSGVQQLPYRVGEAFAGGDETPSNASSIPTSPFYSFSSLDDDASGLNDLGMNFSDMNGFGNGMDMNGMGMDLDLDLDSLLMNGMEMPNSGNNRGEGSENWNQSEQI